MNSNSAPNDAVAPSVAIRGGDILLYDQLPPEFRRFLRELPIEAAARPIYEALREYDEPSVAAVLIQNRQTVIERLRQEMTEALAK